MPFYTPSISSDLLNNVAEEDKNVQITLGVDGLERDPILTELSVAEVSMTESILSPSTHTTITIHDSVHTHPVKILDRFAGRRLNVKLERKILEFFGYPSVLEAEQTIYRLSDREPINYGVEKYELHACDDSLLTNAAKRISKSWVCKSPHQVVNDVFSLCLNVPRYDVESCGPVRTYYADNIHPFQVLAQQADVALYGDNDPCFLHYMSLIEKGTHHFRSLKYLTNQSSVFKFIYSDKGIGLGYADPHNIMKYSFPCDFDILSDILNGIKIDGTESTSVMSYNPFNRHLMMVGNTDTDCGLGGAIYNEAFTNKSTGADVCDTNSERYMAKRQARLSLLDQDKVGIRLTIPFNPNLFAGKMIDVIIPNKPNIQSISPEPDYGSGSYLISTLTHSIKAGGFGVTIVDAVSKSVGLGKV